MGYLHIENLYRPEAQRILEFKRLFALEKIHGTSAGIHWKVKDCLGQVAFFSGGEKHDRFVALFDAETLCKGFREKVGDVEASIYGEAYGGRQQGMSATYGPNLKFVAFDVKIGDSWLAVPQACAFVESLGLEFVSYAEIPATLEAIDAERDRPSTQATRNGVEGEHIREGVVLRPPFEVTLNNGARLIAKHKRAEFSERKTIPNIDPAKAEILEKAEHIAEEWVTAMRMEHVLDHLQAELGREVMIQDMPKVIGAMTEDVLREASGEIVDSKEARKAIGHKTVKMFKARLEAGLRGI